MLGIRNTITGALAIPLFMAFGVAAHADEWNKQTTISVNAPIEVPGAVLPAGSYIFKLVDSQSNRNIVQVLNTRQDHVFATVIAINNYRLRPTGKTVLTFYEVPQGQPAPVRAWFYPGDEYGQEFVYPKREMTQMAQNTQQTVTPAPSAAPAPQEEAQATPAPAPAAEPQQQTQQEEQQTVIAQNEPPAESAPAPSAPAQAPVMPQTASDMPLLALAGLLSISLAGGLSFAAKRTNN
jgi:LPXTG-motif cell wall-anchored protein